MSTECKLMDSSNKENEGHTAEVPPKYSNNARVALLKPKTQRRDTTINDLLVVQKISIDFGNVFAGTILEEDIIIVLKTHEGLYVQTHAICENKEYDDLEEYVYSARKTTNFDYHDKILSTVTKKACVVKIAIKVPNIREPNTIIGVVRITAASLAGNPVQGQISIPIVANVVIPKINCNRLLPLNDIKVIRLAIKFNKNQDTKIPFRNSTNIPLQLETEVLAQELPFTVGVNPTLHVQPEMNFMVVCSVKNQTREATIGDYRSLLIFKVKNSAVLFCFPLLIKLY